jgi:hypothetical protein
LTSLSRPEIWLSAIRDYISAQLTKENGKMAKRPETTTLTKRPDEEEAAPELVSQRKRPEQGQFRLQVDRQTKGAYATSEAAEAVGMAIKKEYPVVQVTVYDVVKSTNKIIELP